MGKKSHSTEVGLFDRERLSDLYDDYAAHLLGIIMRIVSSRTSAERVLYETFLEIWHKRMTYDDRNENIFIWMAKIARKLAIAEIQSEAKVEQNEDEALKKLVYNKQVARYLQGCVEVKELDNIETAALRYVFINSFSFEEVAIKLEIPLETLKNKISLAVTKIMKANDKC